MENEDYVSTIRRQNKAQRSVNKQLRRALSKAQHKMDELFMHMCETPTDAEQALQRLWEEASLEYVCGPEDYGIIVETVLNILNNKPIQSL